MPVVAMPNGDQVAFPDDMPADQIKALILAKFPNAAKAAAVPNAPPDGAKPGSDAYAQWAAKAAASGQTLPQVSASPPDWQPPDFAPAPFRAFVDSSVENTPVVGGLFDQARQAILGPGGAALEQARDEAANRNAPAALMAGQVFGAIAPFAIGGEIPAAAKVLGMDGAMPLAARMGAAGASQLGISTADNMTRGQSLPQAAQNAVAPAGVAAAMPVVGDLVGKMVGKGVDALNAARQRPVTNAAIANAPTAQDLKAQASSLFDKVDNAGVTVDTPAFSQFVAQTVTNAKKMGIDPTLDPKATAAYQRLIGALSDVQQSGGALTVSDLHTLRQIAQSAAQSSEGRDAMFANQIVSGLDRFVQDGKGLSSPSGGNDLLRAISTWGRASRVGRIQQAIEDGSNMASGAENGIRLKFLGLMRDQKFMNQLSPAERQAISDVAHGTTPINLTRLAGRFGVAPTNFLGTTIGATLGGTLGAGLAGPIGGAVGAGAVTGLGTLARAASERLRTAAAERAAQVLATPNVPSVTQLSIPSVIPRIAINVGGRAMATDMGRAP